MTLIDLTARPTTSDRLSGLPVAIIGAGPVGLAAAANLVERGIEVVIFEAGAEAASAIREWGHTRLFSPWRHLVDPAAVRLLTAAGCSLPSPDAAPTGDALVTEYLEPLARLDEIAQRIRFNTRVTDVAREGMDRTRSAGRATTPFVLRVRGADGGVSEVAARSVIDASGTWRSPNALGSNGLELMGLPDIRDFVVGALPDVLGDDRARFAGRRVVVVGAGHSAANTLLALVALAESEPGTRVTWVIRNARAARVTSSEADELAGRARLGGRVEAAIRAGSIEVVDRFEILRAERADERARLVGRRGDAIESIDTDVVVVATGFRPDLRMLREIRLDLDEVVEAPRRLAPLIDPNLHSCGTVEPHGFRELQHPEQGFFIVGMKSYGRAPTFLLATGYEQTRSVAAWLDGDLRAASTVELVLPATGVCSTDQSSGACCS